MYFDKNQIISHKPPFFLKSAISQTVKIEYYGNKTFLLFENIKFQTAHIN